MSKKTIKEILRRVQDGRSLTGADLPSDLSLIDTHRDPHKAQGGTYDNLENVEVLLPVEHMKKHGTYRERPPFFESLKNLMDARAQTMKQVIGTSNRLLAFRRGTDEPHTATVVMLENELETANAHLKALDRDITKHIKSSDDPLIKRMLGVRGLGPVTIAGLLNYVDLEKADSPSALWKYVGLHCPSSERYTKGVASGGNKILRTILWNMAVSMMKDAKSPYRQVYDATKARLKVSDRIVKSYNTQGRLVEVPWKDAKPKHRHGAALRAMIKHLLADFWMVGRAERGLPTRTLYAEQHLGHDGIINPESRGW